MDKSKITSRSIEFGPAIELDSYKWIKTKVTLTFEGGTSEHNLKVAELEYYKAVALDLKLHDAILGAYEEGEDKGIRKLVKKKIESLSNVLNKDS